LHSVVVPVAGKRRASMPTGTLRRGRGGAYRVPRWRPELRSGGAFRTDRGDGSADVRSIARVEPVPHPAMADGGTAIGAAPRTACGGRASCHARRELVKMPVRRPPGSISAVAGLRVASGRRHDPAVPARRPSGRQAPGPHMRAAGTPAAMRAGERHTDVGGGS